MHITPSTAAETKRNNDSLNNMHLLAYGTFCVEISKLIKLIKQYYFTVVVQDWSQRNPLKAC